MNSRFFLTIIAGIFFLTTPGKTALPDDTGKESTFEYTGYGANRCVSGSLHLISIDGDNLILDAGAFYGDDGIG
ncbi:MAG: hypothetical protein U9R36_06675, partial [Elusimicrobiota bacterium]|nr:hypothetical protein [Elusimicrobiota bacterium]